MRWIVFIPVVLIFAGLDAGVGQLDPPFLAGLKFLWGVQLDHGADAIPRDTRRGVHNGHTPPGELVQQAGFAHIGASDDGNLNRGHSEDCIAHRYHPRHAEGSSRSHVRSIRRG